MSLASACPRASVTSASQAKADIAWGPMAAITLCCGRYPGRWVGCRKTSRPRRRHREHPGAPKCPQRQRSPLPQTRSASIQTMRPPTLAASLLHNKFRQLFQEAGGINRCTISGSRHSRSRGLTSRRPAGRSRAWHRSSATLMSGRHGRSIGAAVVAAGSLGKHAGRRRDE